jgi:GWxTD domain-containing protein
VNGKTLKLLIVLSLCLFSKMNTDDLHAAHSERDSLAALLFQKGEAYVSQGDTAKAITCFKKAIGKNRKLAHAHHRLAQLYLGIGTLEYRLQARWALEKAIYLEPQNISFLFTQAQYFQRIEAMGMVERVIKKILKINPDDPHAYFILGKIRERDWFRYEDMVSHQYSGDGSYLGTFTMDRYAKKDLAQARNYYQKAILLNPEFSQGYYRLALLDYEENQYRLMISMLTRALKISPDNKNYHLFLGLAYHRSGNHSRAMDSYQTAESLMSPEEKSLFQSVNLICAPSDRHLFVSSNPDENGRQVQTFWNSRDPLFLTEENERILEHYGRIAYANLRFSRYPENMPGWKTDGGQVIIRYGHPVLHTKTRPDMRCVSVATWNYPGFSLTFEERTLSNRFELNFKSDFKAMTEKIPERFDLIPPHQKFPVVCTSACYQSKNDRTTLEIYQSIPRKNADPFEYGQPDRMLTRGIFLFDQNWHQVDKKISQRPFFYSDDESILSVGWERLQVDPGMYHLVVEFSDQTRTHIGRWQKRVLIEDFSHQDLSVSDIVLAREIGSFLEKGELQRGGMRIVPNTLETYPVTSSIPIYFEIYNLTYSGTGTTHYRMTFSVESMEKKSGISKIVQDIFTRNKPANKVVTSYEYHGDQRNEPLYQMLDIENPQESDYLLIIEIEDLNNGERAVREKTIALREEEDN